jgi:hypothetical protein
MKASNLLSLATVVAHGPGTESHKSAPHDGPAKTTHAPLVIETGVLVFVDHKPAIKTSSGTSFLMMPEFYKHAFFEGFKADMTVKATGYLVAAPNKSSHPTLVAREVVMGNKTYIIIGGEYGHHSHDHDHLDPVHHAKK